MTINESLDLIKIVFNYLKLDCKKISSLDK
jgi:hypothetical protein